MPSEALSSSLCRLAPANAISAVPDGSRPGHFLPMPLPHHSVPTWSLLLSSTLTVQAVSAVEMTDP